jgi:hypothetical protein
MQLATLRTAKFLNSIIDALADILVKGDGLVTTQQSEDTLGVTGP